MCAKRATKLDQTPLAADYHGSCHANLDTGEMRTENMMYIFRMPTDSVLSSSVEIFAACEIASRHADAQCIESVPRSFQGLT